MSNDNPNEEPLCCESALEFDFVEDMRGTDHDDDCPSYDGAPIHQWETTEGGGYVMDTRGEHDPTL